MGLMYFKYKILNVEICRETCICLVLEKKLVKNGPAGDSSSLLNHWVIQTILSKRLNTAGANQMTVFMNGLVNQWFTQANDSDFRFEHKRKHHIVAHRLDNQREIAVICFCSGNDSVNAGVQDPEERRAS